MSHSAYIDVDIIGKSVWIKPVGASMRRLVLTTPNDLLKNYVLVENLAAATSHTIQAAFYDAMIDSQLLEAKIGYLLGDVLTFTTKTPPTIQSYSVTATPVEVGVSLPLITLNMLGDWETLQVEYKLASATEWESWYEGSSTTTPAVSIVPGTYQFRVRGLYLLPDGVTKDFSDWYQYPQDITVDYQQIPPTAATNLTYKVAKINDSFLRYDVRVSWDWEKGSGANIREFIVYYTSASDYSINGWTKAQVINTGATQYVVLPSFPYNIPYKLKVVSRAWGLEDHAYAESNILNLVIDTATIFDNTFTKLTGIDVNYSGIFGYLDASGTRQQTFKLDAGTGSVVIGTPDPVTGLAPFSFDPINKTLNISGKTITDTIYSANFVLTNLTGTPPVLRSIEKTSYANVNQGIWMGYSGTAFKFDLGNSSKYIRWDGSDLMISGKVTIGSLSGDIPLEEALQGKLMTYIYKSDTSLPTTPTSTSYPPSGWSTTPPSKVSGQYIWVSQGLLNPLTNTLQDGQVWTTPIQWSGTDGSTPYIEVFGDNANAVASGYSGHRLVINKTVYSFTQTRGHTLYVINPGTQVVESATTYDTYTNGTSALITALNGIGIGKIVCLSSYDATSCDSSLNTALLNFGGSNITTWTASRYSHVFIGMRGLSVGQGYEKISNSSSSTGVISVGAYFGSSGIVSNGVIGAAGATGATGATGAAGSRGPGIYAQGISAFGGTFSTTAASTFFSTTFGTGPVKYDVLTQYNTASVKTADTKMWNGSSWVDPALVVHGDMIATGTIRGDKIAADAAFFQKAGINIIYNNAAAINANPESVYTMKIDLANGYIHIR